jgi:hypothetical protein
LTIAKPMFLSFNKEAKWVTGFFALYIAVLAFAVLAFGPFYTVTSPIHALVGALALIAFGLVGLRASRMFGGLDNFTGKLMLYYSVTFFAQATSWIIWPFITPGQIPTGGSLIALGLGSFSGQVVAGFALSVSAKSIVNRLDRRSWMLILVSLVFAVLLSLSDATFVKSGEEFFTWVVLWPTLMFVQLAAALLLVSHLGQWYLTRPIGIIAFGEIGYNVAAALLTIIRIASGYPLEIHWVLISLVTAASFYVVALGISQASPMKFGAARAGE